MAHFAKLDTENNVVKVYRVSNKQLLDSDGNESEERGAAFLSTLFGEGVYRQTSYNTRRGEHQLGGTPLRANYCGKGWKYNPDLDIFHPQQPYPSWTLDEVKGQWIPPVPYPENELEEGERPPMYQWNEGEQQWDLIEAPNE